MEEIIKIFVFSSFSIILGLVLLGYSIPSLWLFRNRFWLIGLFVGISIFSMKINFEDHFQTAISSVDGLLSLFCAIMIVGTFTKFYFREVQKNTPLLRYSTENEIVSDTAKLRINKHALTGRVVLTQRRLSFVSNNRGRSQFDFFFADPNFEIKLIKRFGIPYKLKFTQQDISLKVKFPRFWVKEIRNILSQPLSTEFYKY